MSRTRREQNTVGVLGARLETAFHVTVAQGEPYTCKTKTIAGRDFVIAKASEMMTKNKPNVACITASFVTLCGS